MNRRLWLANNRAAIMSRLSWIQEQPDGLLHLEGSDTGFIVLTKTRFDLYLRLVDPAKPNFRLVQSQLNLKQPLYLATRYQQAMLLSLIWQNNPARVCLIGLGGGRIPLVLHHYLPTVTIECVEINPAVLPIAQKFFGLQPDDRLTVTVADGLTYLSQPAQAYDLIFIDAFSAQGQTPAHLTTPTFFALCQKRLSSVGVITLNMIDSDPFHVEKLQALQAVFDHVYLCSLIDGNKVAFAVQGLPLLTSQELLERAQAIQAEHHFSFPFLKRAGEINLNSDMSYKL
jgi:spermidine synthase